MSEWIKIVNLKTRQEIDQFAEYLKAFVDNWCSISFWSTSSHSKIKEPIDWNQYVWLVTWVEAERVDDVIEYLVLSFTKNKNWEEFEVINWIEEAVSI